MTPTANYDPLLAFMAKVEIDSESGCWIWTGSTGLSRTGLSYGRVRRRRKLWQAHRWSYMYFRDESLTSAEEVHHTCGNTLCVHPFHLEKINPTIHRKEHLKPGGFGEYHVGSGTLEDDDLPF